MVTARDRLHIVNCLVRATFAKEATDPTRAKKITVELPDTKASLEFEQAHWILRGYKGMIPGLGFVQVLEQNPAKSGSWCGILATRYQLKVAWLWLNGNYHRCCIDLGGDDVLFFDATGGANATKEEVRSHPQIKAIIEEMDSNREKLLEARTTVKHFN